MQNYKQRLQQEKKAIAKLRSDFSSQIDNLREEVGYLKEMLMAQQTMIDDADKYIQRLEKSLVDRKKSKKQ